MQRNMWKCLLIVSVLRFFFSPASAAGVSFPELCASGTPAQIRAAILDGVDICERNSEGVTPLMFAAANNPDPLAAAALLDAGASLNERDFAGLTPLMGAAMSNPNPQIVVELVEAGAEVNMKGPRDWTALMFGALHARNPEVVAALLEARADARIRNKDGGRAVDYAGGNPHLKGSKAYWLLNEASY